MGSNTVKRTNGAKAGIRTLHKAFKQNSRICFTWLKNSQDHSPLVASWEFRLNIQHDMKRTI